MNIRNIFDVLDTYFRGSAVLKPSYEDYEIDPNFCKVIQVEARFIFFLEIIGKMWEKSISIEGVRISSTFSVLRPFHIFDLFFTSTVLYFDLREASTFCQIQTSYWSRRTVRSTVLVEVRSVGRSTEKVEYMKMVEVQNRSKIVSQKATFWSKN